MMLIKVKLWPLQLITKEMFFRYEVLTYLKMFLNKWVHYCPEKNSQTWFSPTIDVFTFLRNEDHFFIRDIHDTLVSDGDPMGIFILSEKSCRAHTKAIGQLPFPC